jgi:hypothetical protein
VVRQVSVEHAGVGQGRVQEAGRGTGVPLEAALGLVRPDEAGVPQIPLVPSPAGFGGGLSVGRLVVILGRVRLTVALWTTNAARLTIALLTTNSALQDRWLAKSNLAGCAGISSRSGKGVRILALLPDDVIQELAIDVTDGPSFRYQKYMVRHK